MKRTEVMRLSASEREQKLDETRIELMKLRSQAATGTAQKGSGKIRALRKMIARILTAGGTSKA
jgi:large subunit ribosomal protein L29